MASGLPLGGIDGRVIFAKAAGDLGIGLSVAAGNIVGYVSRWEMRSQRDMGDLTPLSVEAEEVVPGHFRWWAFVSGFIDSTEPPGWFNHALATVDLVSTFPGQDFIKGVGWIESNHWISERFSPQIFNAVIRMSGRQSAITWSG